jgi:hypothetical protein
MSLTDDSPPVAFFYDIDADPGLDEVLFHYTWGFPLPGHTDTVVLWDHGPDRWIVVDVRWEIKSRHPLGCHSLPPERRVMIGLRRLPAVVELGLTTRG